MSWGLLTLEAWTPAGSGLVTKYHNFQHGGLSRTVSFWMWIFLHLRNLLWSANCDSSYAELWRPIQIPYISEFGKNRTWECSPALQSDLIHVLSQFQILRLYVLLILNIKSVFPSYVDFGLLFNIVIAFSRLYYKFVYNKLKFIVTKPDCNSCKSCIQIIPGLNCV